MVTQENVFTLERHILRYLKHHDVCHQFANGLAKEKYVFMYRR